MPDLDLGTQLFDLAFSPSHDIVFTGLLTGHVKAFSYDEEGRCESRFSVRPTKKTARSLAASPDGLELYSVSKDKAIYTIGVGTGKISQERLQAHDSSINRVACFMSMLATGDDNGVIKLWDTRTQSSIRSYTHHEDFVSDFVWLEDKKHLLATSGDGTLSVLDVRSNKSAPLAQSENQEDELLSAVSIKSGKKLAVGTQTGVVSIWDRSRGYGDCVDRMLGHPESVDALAALTPDVIVTGSSDGLVRAVQVLPNKLLGVIADHGSFPIERLKVDRNGVWVGSASHDDILKLTDVRDALVDSDDDSDGNGVDESEAGVDNNPEDEEEQEGKVTTVPAEDPPVEEQPTPARSSNEPEVEIEQSGRRPKKRKNQRTNEGKNKKGKVDVGFFAGL